MTSFSDQIGMTLADYPGDFSRDDRSRYDFPEIWYENRNGAKISCLVYVQGCYGSQDQGIVAEQDNSWEPHPIEPSLWEFAAPDEMYFRVQTITTNKKASCSPAQIICVGKNSERSNATTPFQQAMRHAYTDYKDKALGAQKFLPDSPHLADRKANAVTEQATRLAARIPPMLAGRDEPRLWFNNHPYVMVQPKYNGVRTMATRHKSPGHKLVVYSRGLRDAPYSNFTAELEALTNLYPELFFDGEVFLEGASLAEISGSSRNTGKGKTVPLNCNFMVFDVYAPYAPALNYKERHDLYQTIADETKHLNFVYIKFVRALWCRDWEATETLYKSVVDHGYEGLVLKDATAPYEPGWGDYHSSSLCKMKIRYTAEFVTVGWSPGQGKLATAVATFTVKITDQSITDDPKVTAQLHKALGKTFEVTVAEKLKQRQHWYQLFTNNPKHFSEQYAGQLSTIKFFEVSPYGIPTQGVWEAFRDYEGRADAVSEHLSTLLLDGD